MKQVYPQVRPRRLGTRGNSRYCYAGLKKRLKLEEPSTPECGGGKPLKGEILLKAKFHVKSVFGKFRILKSVLTILEELNFDF